MIVQLQNFGKYVQPTTFEFADGLMTVIKGRSGAGKTTIFKAVYWALYDDVKGYRNNRSTGTVVVTVTVTTSRGLLVVQRCKPHKFVCVLNGVEYHDSAGMSLVYQIFGMPEVFQAACYRVQQSQNVLMSTGSANKLALIRWLTFGEHESEVDPKIAKLSQDLQQLSTHIGTILQQLQQAQLAYQQANGPAGGTGITAYTPQQLQQAQHTVTQLRTTIETLERKEGMQIVYRGAVAQLKQQLSELRVGDAPEALPDLNGMRAELDKLRSAKQRYQQQQQRIQELAQAPEVTMAQVTQARTERSAYLQYRQDEQLLQRLRQQYTQHWQCHDDAMSDIQKAMPDSQPADILLLLDRQLQALQHNQAVAAALLPYADLTEATATQHVELLQAYQEWQRYDGYMRSKPPVPANPEPQQQAIDALRQQIYQLQQAIQQWRSPLVCPHCNGKVVMEGTARLVPHQHGDAPDPDQLKAYQQMLDDSLRYQSVWRQYHYSMQQWQQQAIHERPAVVLPEGVTMAALPRLRQYLQAIHHHVAVPVPLEIDKATAQRWQQTLRNVDTVARQRTECQQLEQRITPHPEVTEAHVTTLVQQQQRYSTLQAQCTPLLDAPDEGRMTQLEASIQQHSELAAAHTRYHMLLKRQQELTQQLQYQQSLVDDTVATQLSAAREQLQHTQSTITTMTQHMQWQQLWSQYQYWQQQHQQYSRQHQVMGRLLTIFNNANYGALTDMVQGINAVLPPIISALFDSSIVVKLSMYDEIKQVGGQSNIRIISKISLDITMDGEEFSVHMLSGGEQDRISFAITVALCKIVGSPLMMLDEAFASISNDAKAEAIRLVKAQCPGITILSIAHDGIDGEYDHRVILAS